MADPQVINLINEWKECKLKRIFFSENPQTDEKLYFEIEDVETSLDKYSEQMNTFARELKDFQELRAAHSVVGLFSRSKRCESNLIESYLKNTFPIKYSTNIIDNLSSNLKDTTLDNNSVGLVPEELDSKPNKSESGSQTYLFQPGSIGIYVQWTADWINALIHYSLILNNDEELLAKTSSLRLFILHQFGVRALCEFLWACELLEIASMPVSGIQNITWKTADGVTWKASASSQVNIQRELYDEPKEPDNFGLPTTQLLEEYINDFIKETNDGWSEVINKTCDLGSEDAYRWTFWSTIKTYIAMRADNPDDRACIAAAFFNWQKCLQLSGRPRTQLTDLIKCDLARLTTALPTTLTALIQLLAAVSFFPEDIRCYYDYPGLALKHYATIGHKKYIPLASMLCE